MKNKVSTEIQKETVYQIKCKWGESYIRESGRPISIKMNMTTYIIEDTVAQTLQLLPSMHHSATEI